MLSIVTSEALSTDAVNSRRSAVRNGATSFSGQTLAEKDAIVAEVGRMTSRKHMMTVSKIALLLWPPTHRVRLGNMSIFRSCCRKGAGHM